MAKKQQIILTHGSATPNADVIKGLKLGEVLVQHAADAKEVALHTVNKEGDETALISFPSKAYVDDQIANVDASGITAAIAAEKTARENADKAINEKIGDGFSSSNTITKAIADETKAREDEDTAIKGRLIDTIEITNTATNKITATKVNNTVTFNFDNMVIDGGTY
jgi:hypothetical protein